MNAIQAIKLSQLNKTGGDVILENIIALISEGYGVAIMPEIDILCEDDELYPGFVVEIFDSLGDNTPVTKAVDTRLADALTAAYQMTPER